MRVAKVLFHEGSAVGTALPVPQKGQPKRTLQEPTTLLGKLCAATGLTQEQLGERAGIKSPREQVARWKNGGGIGVKNLILLQKAFPKEWAEIGGPTVPMSDPSARVVPTAAGQGGLTVNSREAKFIGDLIDGLDEKDRPEGLRRAHNALAEFKEILRKGVENPHPPTGERRPGPARSGS